MNLYLVLLVITTIIYLRPELPREELLEPALLTEGEELLDEELLLTDGED